MKSARSRASRLADPGRTAALHQWASLGAYLFVLAVIVMVVVR